MITNVRNPLRALRHARAARRATCGALVALAVGASAAAAPPPNPGSAPALQRSVTAAPTPAATFTEECGTCHVAYPARLLGAAQWMAVLSALDDHYGVDATLDPETLALVARHLGVVGGVPHAGAAPRPASTRAASALPRITTQPWFVREHREANVARSGHRISQCDACHAGAAQGSFEDDERTAARDRNGRHEEHEEHEEHEHARN
jgi:hypothetical protein